MLKQRPRTSRRVCVGNEEKKTTQNKPTHREYVENHFLASLLFSFLSVYFLFILEDRVPVHVKDDLMLGAIPNVIVMLQ